MSYWGLTEEQIMIAESRHRDIVRKKEERIEKIRSVLEFLLTLIFWLIFSGSAAITLFIYITK